MLILALVGSAAATTCDTSSISTCITNAASGLSSCAGYQTYFNCYSSCGSNSTYCTTFNTWYTSVQTAFNALGCSITNPCSSTPTPTPAVTTATQSQKIDMTLSGYTGAMKS